MSGERSFWARRKAGVAAEAEAEQAATDAQVLAEEHRALEEQSDAEILAALDLPDPETMRMGDDFTAFMAKAVPDRIRRRALRTLWRSNPVLANIDMLVDYGEDYTDSAMVVDNLQTGYRVGKGMLKHVEALARQAEDQEPPPAPQVAEEAQDEEETIALSASDEAETTPANNVEAHQNADAFETPTPRRMKFRLEETA